MIRASKIQIYLRLIEKLGLSREVFLAKSRIDPGVLSAPDGVVARDSYYAAIMNLINLTDDPAVAFALGDVVEIGDFGILGYAMLSSTTLGQVVRIRRQYHDTTFGTMVTITAAKDAHPGYELTLASTALTETLRRFEIEEFLVEGMTLVKLLTGVTPVIRRLTLAYAKPPYSAAYKAFFKCPVDFGAPQTVFSVRTPGFSAPIASGNAELHNVCARHCQEVLRVQAAAGPLQLRLRDLFLTSPGRLPGLKAVAGQMGMSERSLRRHLDAEGLNFRALKDEFRLNLSRQLLSVGRMAPKEVAYLLGYASPSAFSRAFKTWTGTTIGGYLRNPSGTQ